MKTIEINSYYGTETHEVNIMNYEICFKGRGHWKILFDVEFKNNRHTVGFTTTDSMAIDEHTELRADDPSWDDLLQCAINKWFDGVSDDVAEWCDEVNKEE